MAPDRLAWPGGLGGGRIMVLQSYRQRNEKGEYLIQKKKHLKRLSLQVNHFFYIQI